MIRHVLRLAAVAAALVLLRPGPAVADAAAAPAWWWGFGDPVLDELEVRAGAGDVSIQQAQARLALAQSQARLPASAGAAVLTGRLEGSDRSGPLINAAGGSGSLYNGVLDLSVELDVFGRLSKARRAARLDVRAESARLDLARLLTQANLAQTYFQIRGLDEERELLAGAVASYGEGLRLLQGRRASGLESDLAIARAEGELGAAKAELIELDRRRTALVHGLAVLVGEPAPDFRLAPGRLPLGAPSEAAAKGAGSPLASPEIAAARAASEAASVRLDLARTAWLPSVQIAGVAGAASGDLGGLLDASARSFGASWLALLPLLDGGRRKAGVEGARAQVDLADAELKGQILAAWRDFADQVDGLAADRARSQVLEATLDADRRISAMTATRVADGLGSRLELIDAHRTELRDARAALQARASAYVRTVGLMRALGGSTVP